MKYLDAYNNENMLKSDKIFAFLAMAMFCHSTLLEYVAVVVGGLPIISYIRPLFYPIVYFSLFILSYRKDRYKNIRATDVLILLLFTMAVLFTYNFYPVNSEFITLSMYDRILPCIPFFILGLTVSLDEYTYSVLGKFSCVAIVVNMIYILFFLSEGGALGGSHGEDYSMHRAYLILPNVLIALDYAFTKKKLYAIVSVIVGIIYVFAMGTRGAIVIVFAFIIACIWMHTRIDKNKKIFIMLILGIIVYFFAISSAYTEILGKFKVFLDRNGFSSRIIDYMISGELVSETSGRDDIYSVLISKLMEKPFTGYGVYGEYPLGYHAGAHNIYLEVLFHYGIPLGLVIIFLYLTVFVKGLKRSQGKLSHNWIVMIGCLVFVKGIFGSRYFDYPVFFLLGLCLKELREREW